MRARRPGVPTPGVLYPPRARKYGCAPRIALAPVLGAAVTTPATGHHPYPLSGPGWARSAFTPRADWASSAPTLLGRLGALGRDHIGGTIHPQKQGFLMHWTALSRQCFRGGRGRSPGTSEVGVKIWNSRGTGVPNTLKSNETITKHFPAKSARKCPGASQRCHGEARVRYIGGRPRNHPRMWRESPVLELTLVLRSLGLGA